MATVNLDVEPRPDVESLPGEAVYVGVPWYKRRSGGRLIAWGGVLMLIVLAAVFAPLLSPHDPLDQEISQRLLPPFWAEGGSLSFPLGTDQLGRDVLSRIIYGSRISLVVGFGSVSLAVILGVTLGLIAGYYRGPVRELIMRLADLQLTFPFLAIAITVVAVLGASTRNLLIVLALWAWPAFTRLTQSQVLAIRELDYVMAARALGAGAGRILFRHLLPNSISPLIVLWTFTVAQMIIAEASLSFLGVGVQPPQPSWGNMMNDGQTVMAVAWWLETLPGLAILITVLAINQFGDALRDVTDPQGAAS